jgi:hypothetical protein
MRSEDSRDPEDKGPCKSLEKILAFTWGEWELYFEALFLTRPALILVVRKM